MADDERVSLNEIVEVRDAGFNSAELLAIIYASCEHLLSKPAGKKGLFSPNLIYITHQGRIQIDFLESVLLEFTPPELHSNPHSSTNDPQIVWCLGEIVRRISQADCADADLFSLINLMTVAHEPTRPTIQRLLQMTKNKLANPDGVPKLLTLLFQELMGDIEELADSSDLESIATADHPPPPTIYTTKIAQMTRASTSVSSTPAVSTTSHSELQSLESSDEGSLVDGKENVGHSQMSSTVQYPINNGIKQAVVGIADDDSSLSMISEESVTTKSRASTSPPTPIVERSEPVFVVHENVNTKVRVIEEKPIHFEPFIPTKTFHEQEMEVSPIVYPTASPVVSPIIAPARSTNVQQNTEIETVSMESSPKLLNFNKTNEIRAPSRTNTEPVEVEIHHELSRPSTPIKNKLPFEIMPKMETTPVSARRRSSGVIVMEEDSETPEKLSSATQSISTTTFPPQSAVSPSFSRHNSMKSNEIRRRSTARRQNRKTTSIPEFVEKRALPLIRLRAQSQKRRRMSLLRVEDTLVLVKLLNGQSIELNCRSDVLVLNIFDTIVAHLNITEHSFFGLAVLKGSEFYFLDNDQRLEKFAPTGWKTIVKSGGAPNFSLYLRFKFYPKRTEFLRNEVTMHLLYLQLRQDILSGILTGPKQHLLEAGSIALQFESQRKRKALFDGLSEADQKAEFSDRPQHVTEYFDVHNYLPNALLTGLRSDELKNIQNNLVQMHSTHSGNNRRQAERTFIQLAQTFPCFGAHFYAVYKFKPPKQKERSSIINDIQNIQLISIMPHGVGICRNAALLSVNVTFEWPFIRTLQYDGKRFLISTIENNIAVDHVFYTDHFTKSRYLVRFAADQHRFMIRMRQWQAALIQARMPVKDVGVDEEHEVSPLQHTARQQQRTVKQQDVEMTNEYIENCYGSDAMRLSVTLEKHPSQGLGLTLVDGSVNGIKGVYVKSVAPEGDGRRKGLQVGDCILKISGVSLFNKSRHDAVDLVKECERDVHLEVLRFHSITAVLSETTTTMSPIGQQQPIATNSDSSTSKRMSDARKESNGSSNTESKKSWPAPKFPDDSNSNLSDRARTPPPQRKSQSSSAVLIQKRQRAVSDFGAIGDTLPKMSSDYLLASMEKLSKPADSDSSSENENNDDVDKAGAYSVNEMYNFNRNDELDFHQTSMQNTSLNFSDSRNAPTPGWSQANPAKSQKHVGQLLESTSAERNGNLYQQKGKSRSDMKPSDRMHINGAVKAIEKSTSKNGNLDWTNDLSDIEDGGSEERSERANLVNIQLNRIPGHSLGFRIASSNGRAYVKQVTSEPAISAKLKLDDRVISINGQSVDGMNHQEIVNLLRNGGNVVRIVVERSDKHVEASTEETIKVVLDKSKSSSLGLSLAKRINQAGVFIRNIVPGSAVDQSNLKVGDQILMLNGESIIDENPTDIVERLRLIAGTFELVVKRTELN